MMSLNGVAAITGFAEFPRTTGETPTPLAMTARLARETIEDAGFEKADIDGLITTTPHQGYSLYWSTVVAEALGLSVRYFDTVDLGGASSAGMVWRARRCHSCGPM